jgi:hypothetical protein
MADKLIHIGQEMAGDAINTVAEQANDFVQDASNKAATDKASTLGEQIANYTCDKLNEKIPNIVGSITNEVISKLRTKIDSEEFTTNFISVLRDKLLDNEEYTDKFLSKFDRLFDTILKDAKDRHDKKELANMSETNKPSYEGAGYHKQTKRNRKRKPYHKKTKRVRFSTKK